MTDFDLERLGELWRRELDAGAVEDMRRAAEATRRKARMAALFDYALAALIVATVLFIVAVDPKIESVLVGGLAILVLVTSQLRQRRFRRLELKGLSGGTEAMINQSIEHTEAALKRASSGLFVIGPATLLGALFGLATNDSQTGSLLAERLQDPLLRIAIIAFWGLVFPAILVHLILTMRRCRRELRRLTELRELYRQESDAIPPE